MHLGWVFSLWKLCVFVKIFELVKVLRSSTGDGTKAAACQPPEQAIPISNHWQSLRISHSWTFHCRPWFKMSIITGPYWSKCKWFSWGQRRKLADKRKTSMRAQLEEHEKPESCRGAGCFCWPKGFLQKNAWNTWKRKQSYCIRNVRKLFVEFENHHFLVPRRPATDASGNWATHGF